MWLRSKPGGTQVGSGAEGVDSLTLLEYWSELRRRQG